ncbi:MAG: glycosyltransferase family 2 protein [Bacteroidales bacterium]
MKKTDDKRFPLVSIISINYNQSDVTLEMLESLRKVTYPNFEMIIVDNASPSDNPDIITQKFPDVTLLKSKENLGFAGGNNIGIEASKGEYILLLNNDTEVDAGFLEPMVKKFRENPEIGVISPKIYFHHTPGMLQFTGISKINKYTTRSKGWGHGKMDTGQFDQDKETFFGHGAAMMVPRTVIKKVGMMAPVYFLYYEEMDWVQRIRNAGYQAWYVHNSTVYHKESISTGKQSPLKIYYINRARIIYLQRNTKGLDRIFALLFQSIVSVPKNLIMFMINGRTDLLNAYRKAIGWNIKRLGSNEIFFNPDLKN